MVYLGPVHISILTGWRPPDPYRRADRKTEAASEQKNWFGDAALGLAMALLSAKPLIPRFPAWHNTGFRV